MANREVELRLSSMDLEDMNVEDLKEWHEEGVLVEAKVSKESVSVVIIGHQAMMPAIVRELLEGEAYELSSLSELSDEGFSEILKSDDLLAIVDENHGIICYTKGGAEDVVDCLNGKQEIDFEKPILLSLLKSYGIPFVTWRYEPSDFKSFNIEAMKDRSFVGWLTFDTKTKFLYPVCRGEAGLFCSMKEFICDAPIPIHVSDETEGVDLPLHTPPNYVFDGFLRVVEPNMTTVIVSDSISRKHYFADSERIGWVLRKEGTDHQTIHALYRRGDVVTEFSDEGFVSMGSYIEEECYAFLRDLSHDEKELDQLRYEQSHS